MNQDQASESKLVHEIEASNDVIDMMELWLNKAKEAKAVKNHITVVDPSSEINYKKILFKSLNPKKIRKVETIVKDLMNLDVNDSK